MTTVEKLRRLLVLRLSTVDARKLLALYEKARSVAFVRGEQGMEDLREALRALETEEE